MPHGVQEAAGPPDVAERLALPVQDQDRVADPLPDHAEEPFRFRLGGVAEVRAGEVVEADGLAGVPGGLGMLTPSRVFIAHALSGLDDHALGLIRDRAHGLVHGDVHAPGQERRRLHLGPTHGRRSRGRRAGVAQAGGPLRGPRVGVVRVPDQAGLALCVVGRGAVVAGRAHDVAHAIDPRLGQHWVLRIEAASRGITHAHGHVPRLQEQQVPDVEAPGWRVAGPGIANVGEATGQTLGPQAPGPERAREKLRARDLGQDLMEGDVVGPRDTCGAVHLPGRQKPPGPVRALIGRPTVGLGIAHAPVVLRSTPVPHLARRIVSDRIRHSSSPSGTAKPPPDGGGRGMDAVGPTSR